MDRLSDIGENQLIERLLSQLSVESISGNQMIVGPGDDCAVIDVGLADVYQLMKTDSLVEGVHYLAETEPERVGWKAIARVVSDFAAMGGWAGQLLVTIAMPGDVEVGYLEKLYQGMQRCAHTYGANICGGETSSVPDGSAAVISVAGSGWVKKYQYTQRSGGQVGDRILVTGRLGGSSSGKHLDFKPRIKEAKWLTENCKINAMMDLSDGLGQDLPRLAKASQRGYSIDESSLPCSPDCTVHNALSDGEDYELLLTVSELEAGKLLEKWQQQFPELPLTVVGQLTERSGGSADRQSGWQHFKSSD